MRAVNVRSFKDELDAGGAIHALLRQIQKEDPGALRRLLRDFPYLWGRYGTTLKRARMSAADVVYNMGLLRGDFGAYTLRSNDPEAKLIGVATYDFHTRFTASDGTTVTGPLVAMWAAPRKLRPELPMLPEMFEHAEEVLRGVVCLRGTTPWTVVRPDHARVITALTTTDVFDGFTPRGEPARYSQLDGVGLMRQVYVANRPL